MRVVQHILPLLLSVSLAFAEEDRCPLEAPQPAPQEVQPAFVPSYPGSGSSMVRVLIPALTGMKMSVPSKAVDGVLDAVAYKTHFPHIEFLPPWADNVHRVVILLRNPMSAIPSYGNFVYEHTNGFQTHTVKAPTEWWLQWRDENFQVEMDQWVALVDYWMENERIQDRFILSYENVVSPSSGPETSMRLSEFFQRSPGVPSIAPETASCVWTKLVQKDQKSTALRGGENKRKGPKSRDYTSEQLQVMVNTLAQLSRKYAHARDLVKVLNRYVIEVSVAHQTMLEKLEIA